MISTSTCDFYNPNSQGVFASSTCVIQTDSSSSTMPQVYNGFSYGDIVIGILIFLILAIIAYSFVWFWLKGVKIRQ